VIKQSPAAEQIATTVIQLLLNHTATFSGSESEFNTFVHVATKQK
jgi:hypothetical protein